MLTGTLANARSSLRLATSAGGVIDGAAADPATKTPAKPTTVQVTFADGAGDLRFEIDGPLALGRQTAAPARLRIKDESALTVGNCVGQAAVSRLWLSKRDGSAVEGSFVLQNLSDSSKTDCAAAALSGSLVGCFAF